MSIESTVTKTIYPSFENCQLTDTDEVNPAQAAAMLKQLVDHTPADRRDSLVLSGWSGVKVRATVTLTKAEQDAEVIRRAIALVDAAGREGLSAEALAELRSLLA